MVASLSVSSAFAATGDSSERTMANGTLRKVYLQFDEFGNVTYLPEQSCARSITLPAMIIAFPADDENLYTLEFTAMNLPDMLYTDRIFIRVALTSDTGYKTATTLNKRFSSPVQLAGQSWEFPDVNLPAGHTYTMEITSMTITLYDLFGASIDADEYIWDVTLLDIDT